MARAVNWVLAGIDVLARALGVSARTARRRAADMPGAVKGPKGWTVPVSTAVYARGAGVSERTARRRAVAKAVSPTDPAVQSQMPARTYGKGPVPTTFSSRMVSRRVWGYQYQGWAWLRFVTSGDIIRWFTGIIVSKVPMTWTQLDAAIRREVGQVFGNSPVRIMSTGLVYAHHG